MNWSRGKIIGRGTFGSVYLAVKRSEFSDDFNSLMAVKSCLASDSCSLQKEKTILDEFRDCAQILDCFGEDYTVENGERVYNLHLELASRGNLSQLIKNSGGSISEYDVRRYTRSILQGLLCIHDRGYAHCDVKLQNILLSNESGEVKIADFGLAKRTGNSMNSSNFGGSRCGGTPLYMAPESIVRDERESACDIWALGCVVSEMISGKPAWRCDCDASALLFKIGFGDELPEIPDELSEEGKDFLRRCFVRDPSERWTAEMLLNHQFVVSSSDCSTVRLSGSKNASPSPRSAFDFPDWISPRSSSSDSNCSSSDRWDRNFDYSSSSPDDRIEELQTRNLPNWCNTESWVTVREAESPVFRRIDRNGGGSLTIGRSR